MRQNPHRLCLLHRMHASICVISKTYKKAMRHLVHAGVAVLHGTAVKRQRGPFNFSRTRSDYKKRSERLSKPRPYLPRRLLCTQRCCSNDLHCEKRTPPPLRAPRLLWECAWVSPIFTLAALCCPILSSYTLQPGESKNKVCEEKKRTKIVGGGARRDLKALSCQRPPRPPPSLCGRTALDTARLSAVVGGG